MSQLKRGLEKIMEHQDGIVAAWVAEEIKENDEMS